MFISDQLEELYKELEIKNKLVIDSSKGLSRDEVIDIVNNNIKSTIKKVLDLFSKNLMSDDNVGYQSTKVFVDKVIQLNSILNRSSFVTKEPRLVRKNSYLASVIINLGDIGKLNYDEVRSVKLELESRLEKLRK